MKHFLLLILLVVFIAASLSPTFAQVPRMLSYQGLILDPMGKPIADGPHNIRLKLYDALDAATPIYTEDQTNIVFIKGIFNVMIGSATTIPATIAFDKGYFLGVSVDAGSEMTPRTPLSAAPYALHAMVADAITPGASGVVSSINGQSGAVTLQAGNGAIVTNNGSTITISSTGGAGGTGIQGVQNSDPSIVVANPTGPIASLSVGLGGITTTKIADGAVILSKIDASGANAGTVLTANGLGGVSWANVPASASLVLPYSNTVSDAGSLFSVNNAGTGPAGTYTISNAASTAFALQGFSNGAANGISVYGQNNGNGRGGFFEINNAANSSTALSGKTQGTGNAMDVMIANTNNSADALHTTTTGTGRAGYFSVTNGSAAQPALEVTTTSTSSSTLGILSTLTNTTSGASNVAAAIKGNHEGTNGIGIGVWGNHAGTGTGVFGSVSGSGGYGVSATGFGAASTAMLATYSGGQNGGISLELNNGYIKVSGNNKTAYVHTTSAANQDPNNTNSSILSYPGMAQTDMVIVTHYFAANRLNNGYGVWWNANNLSWEIFLENNPAAVMPNGEKFNVLVIKQ